MARDRLRRSAGVPGGVLRVSARSDRRARPPRRRRVGHGRPRRLGDRRDRLVHGLAGGRVDGAHDRRRAAGVVRPRPLLLPRPQRGPGAGRRAVRPPHGRRRPGVPRRAAARPRARLGADSRRARLLQRRGRRPDRRDVLGEPRSAPVGGRRDPGGVAGAAPLGDHGSAPRTRPRRGRRDRVPLLVHVVRGRAHPRRPRLRDDRGRDLQRGGQALRPACRGRALARAARVRRAGRVGLAPPRVPARGEGAAAGRARRAPAATHGAREDARGGKPRRSRAVPGPPAGSPDRALTRGRRELRRRRLPGPRPPDERAPGIAVGGDRELDPLRGRGDAYWRSSSAVWPPSPWPDGTDRASSTGCCCSRSARPR